MKIKTKLFVWICILLIEKGVAQNRAIQRKQFLKRGNCAQKEKSILMAMWNRDLIEFQLGYTHMSSDFPCFLPSEQDVSDWSLLGIIHVISKVQTIMPDAVVRFNPSFPWTALSGFQSTGIPFFAQAAFSGFRLAGCTIFSFSYP